MKVLFLSKMEKYHRTMEHLRDQLNSASPLLCKSSMRKDEEEKGGEEKRGKKKGEDERISTNHMQWLLGGNWTQASSLKKQPSQYVELEKVLKRRAKNRIGGNAKGTGKHINWIVKIYIECSQWVVKREGMIIHYKDFCCNNIK